MKIEYLAEGTRDCPLIRLYEFGTAETCALRELVRSLIAGERQSAAIHREAWAEPIGGCCLTFRRGNRNQGVRQTDLLNFECVLSPDGWTNVEGLLDPFCVAGGDGFQWLTQDGSVSLLLSKSGQW
jgi:hypothetical protein